jgi:Na+/H+ antiporter NhaD/arsenite permease-like protein
MTHSISIPLVSTIFGLTYLALALGKVPGLRIDRARIALVGAAAMMACGALSTHDVAKAVDYETIVLLFGMMVVVSLENARRAGTELSFLEYLKVGVPLTVITTVVGIAWLLLVHY